MDLGLSFGINEAYESLDTKISRVLGADRTCYVSHVSNKILSVELLLFSRFSLQEIQNVYTTPCGGVRTKLHAFWISTRFHSSPPSASRNGIYS